MTATGAVVRSETLTPRPRAGEAILVVHRHPTPLGEMHVVLRDDVLCALEFEDLWARAQRFLERRFRALELRSGAADARPVTRALDAYFAGQLGALDALAVDPGGSDFQRAVWSALRRVPAGTTTSYGALARQIGRPSASRAVGAANGANPVALVIPCHRAIGSTGALTGYAGGLPRKQWLLAHEQRQ